MIIPYQYIFKFPNEIATLSRLKGEIPIPGKEITEDVIQNTVLKNYRG